MSDLPRVLFVEDELLEARAFVRCLRGFAEPSLAFTARQAKDMLRDGAFAAWIIDIHLPDGNGIDLLTFGRTLYASTPAVLVSGAVQVGHINLAYSLKATLLRKPFPMEWLRQFVQQAPSPSPAPQPIATLSADTTLPHAVAELRTLFVSVR